MTKDMGLATKAPLIRQMTDMVWRFNRAIIGLPIPEKPTDLSEERLQAAVDHLHEELTEFAKARDLLGRTDALLDLIYVALGRLVEMGVAPGPVFEEVHRANMAKQRGTVPKRPNAAGHDAVKPDGWRGPELEPYLTVTKADLDWLFEQNAMAEEYDWPDEEEHSPQEDHGDLDRGPITHPQRGPDLMMGADFASGPDRTVIGYTTGTANTPRTAKDTAGKPMTSRIPYEFEEATAEVFEYGSRRYSWDGYKVSPPTVHDLLSALRRHASKMAAGQDLDLDEDGEASKGYSGLHHVGHMGCCVAMLAWVLKNRPDRDDRTRKGAPSWLHR